MDEHAMRADLELFGDALTCEERLQCAFLADDGRGATPDETADAAEALLRNFGSAEETHADDGEGYAGDPALQRLEAKLNLVLRLVAELARNESLPWRDVRWSRRGLSLICEEMASVNDRGRVRLALGAQLPLPLELPVRVLASEPTDGGHRLRLKLDPARPALEAAIERHLFRLHRRAIARRGK